jgi:homoserine dehydrogenase
VREIRIAIAGFGKVGQAIATSLLAQRGHYAATYDADVRLVAVCGSNAGVANAGGLSAEQMASLEVGRTGADFLLSNRPDIIIEAGPSDYQSGEPGLGYLRPALTAGCDAIVVSKGALVRDGRELRDLARASGTGLQIGGAAGSGLPAIDLLRQHLINGEIVRVEAILNVTTTYLLDAMMTGGVTLAEALVDAQASGFVERDPRHDIEGWDAAAKLLLLANFGLEGDLTIDDITVDGIQGVTEAKVAQWRAQESMPRLIGTLARSEGRLRGEVGIRAYLTGDPMALVRGKSKAIRIATQGAGEIMVTGGGPEPDTTAATALNDLDHILRTRYAARKPA